MTAKFESLYPEASVAPDAYFVQQRGGQQFTEAVDTGEDSWPSEAVVTQADTTHKIGELDA